MGTWGNGPNCSGGGFGVWRPMAGANSSERATRSGLHNKATKRERTSSAADSEAAKVLRAQQRRQGVRGPAAAASRDHVIDGLLQFDAGALDTFEIVSERSGNRLFNCVRFWWHTCFRGLLPQFPLFCHFGGWGVGRQRSAGGAVPNPCSEGTLEGRKLP